MQNVAQLIDQKLLDGARFSRIRAFGVNGGSVGFAAVEILEGWRFYKLPRLALIPGAARVDLAVVPCPGRIVEELVDELGRGRDFSNAEGRLAHALQRKGERPHMGDLSRHEELERVLGTRVTTEIDEPLVDDFRSRLCGDIAAQVDIELAGDLEIVGGPGIPHGVEEVDATAPG